MYRNTFGEGFHPQNPVGFRIADKPRSELELAFTL